MTPDRLDPFAILDALGLKAVRATPVAGGADTALWRIETEDRAYALRVLRPDQGGQFRRELAAMAAASAGGAPVPAVHSAGDWRGHHVMVLAWCSGQTLVEALRQRPDQAHALGLGLGRALARIHALPAPPELAGTPTGWIEWAHPDDALRAHLLRLATRPPVLLHLDYHPLNVMVEDGAVSAVLDWANARPGDPRADVARTLAIVHHTPVATVHLERGTDPRRALTAGFRAGYAAIAGKPRQMAAFHAWAGTGMVHDLAPRLGRPDLPWLTPTYLDRVRAWTAGWRARAGLPPAPPAGLTTRQAQPDRR